MAKPRLTRVQRDVLTGAPRADLPRRRAGRDVELRAQRERLLSAVSSLEVFECLADHQCL